MRNFLFFLLFSILLVSYSCKKKNEAPASKPFLMTVNVQGRFFNPVLGGVIYISDMQGKVLSDTFCLADGIYKFYGQAGTSAPSALEVTTVRAEPSSHSFLITIQTYTYISPSEWTLIGSRADTVGHIFPSYKNIPAHNDAFIVSSSGYSNLTLTPGILPIPLYKNPDDIYIGIPTSSGLKYKWFNGVHAFDTDTFDLSNALPAEKQSISFPAPVEYYECRVQGFTDGNFTSPIPYMVDETLGNGTIVSSFDAYYPPSKFQGFHTDIMAVENYSLNQNWYYHVDGQIPSAFRKINASLNSFTPSNTSVMLNASGDLDAVAGTWQFQNAYKGYLSWTVFGPDSSKVLNLPQIAGSLSNMFPWLNRDSLSFSTVQLIDLVNCHGYNQMINQLYNPANPSDFVRQETSSLSVSLP